MIYFSRLKTEALIETGGRVEEKNRFIDLRARGYSYSKIAEELRVSKATLTLWDKDLKEEIKKLRALQLDELYTKYSMLKEARITKLGDTLERVEQELGRRNLSAVSTDKLLDYKMRFMKELREEYIDPQEDRNVTKLNAKSILSELFTLLERLRGGEITKDQANREGIILGAILKAYEAHSLEEKIASLEAIIGRR